MKVLLKNIKRPLYEAFDFSDAEDNIEEEIAKTKTDLSYYEIYSSIYFTPKQTFKVIANFCKKQLSNPKYTDTEFNVMYRIQFNIGDFVIISHQTGYVEICPNRQDISLAPRIYFRNLGAPNNVDINKHPLLAYNNNLNVILKNCSGKVSEAPEIFEDGKKEIPLEFDEFKLLVDNHFPELLKFPEFLNACKKATLENNPYALSEKDIMEYKSLLKSAFLKFANWVYHTPNDLTSARKFSRVRTGSKTYYSFKDQSFKKYGCENLTHKYEGFIIGKPQDIAKLNQWTGTYNLSKYLLEDPPIKGVKNNPDFQKIVGEFMIKQLENPKYEILYDPLVIMRDVSYAKVYQDFIDWCNSLN